MRVGQGVSVQGMAIHVRLPKANVEERRAVLYLVHQVCLSGDVGSDVGLASVEGLVLTILKIKFFTVRMEGVAKVCVPTVLLCKLTR